MEHDGIHPDMPPVFPQERRLAGITRNIEQGRTGESSGRVPGIMLVATKGEAMRVRATIMRSGVPNANGNVCTDEAIIEAMDRYAGSTAETIGGRLCLVADVTVQVRCDKCGGCGQVADTKEQEPWKEWSKLPVESAGAVLAGLVHPINCPKCFGSCYL